MPRDELRNDALADASCVRVRACVVGVPHIAMALAVVAEEAGCDLHEALKAGPGERKHEAQDFGERYMREIWRRLSTEHSGWIQRVLDDLEGMLARGDIGFPLDVERGQHELVAHRLALHAASLLHQIGIKDPNVREALARDILGRAPWIIDVIDAGYRLGLVHQAVGPEAPWTKAWEVASKAPYTDVDRAMVAHARARAGAYLRRVAYTASDAANEKLLDRDFDITRRRVMTGVRAKIHPHRLAGFMADLTGHKEDRGDGKLIWAGGDWSRDWRRVARTEMASAHAHGALSALLHKHPENADRREGEPLKVPRVLAFKQPQKVERRGGRLWRPCDHCYRIWYADDQTPRLYLLDDIVANGDNFGVPARDWKATVGPTHPNDLCGPVREFIPATLALYPGMRKQIETWRGKGIAAVEESSR